MLIVSEANSASTCTMLPLGLCRAYACIAYPSSSVVVMVTHPALKCIIWGVCNETVSVAYFPCS